MSVNIEWVIGYGFPVVIAAAALECDYLSDKLRVPAWAPWTPMLLVGLLWAAHFSELAAIRLKVPMAVLGVLTVALVGLRVFRPALQASRKALGLRVEAAES